MNRARTLFAASDNALNSMRKHILRSASGASVQALEPRRLLAVAAISDEFLVSDSLGNMSRTSSSVAHASDGSFVVAYLAQSSGGGAIDVAMRRFDADGDALASAVLVNQTTAGDQSRPQTAMEDNGDYVIAWLDHASGHIMARRYNAAGTALAGEFQVSANAVGPGFHLTRPDVAMDANGDFAIAWARDIAGDDDVKYRVYNNAGTAVTGELQANTTTAGVQSAVEVAMDDAGTFVVTWESAGADGSGQSIRARQFDVLGAALTSEFAVNTFTTGDQIEPSIGNDDTGEFVIAWSSIGQDGSAGGIYAKRFNDLAVVQGSEFRVNTVTTDDQRLPSVAVDDFGDFVIAFDSMNQDGSQEGVFARGYEADGTSDGGVFAVNTVTSGIQFDATVSFDEAADKFTIAWTNSVGNATVKARRFIMDRIAPAAPSAPNLLPQSDSGTSNSDDITNDSTPTFLVAGEDDSTVQLFVDGILAATDFSSSGAHTVTIPASFNLSDGVHSITARQLDQAGNISPLSGSLEISLDTVAPAAPDFLDLASVSDTGISNSDNITSDTTPSMGGQADNGTTVEIFEGNTVLASTQTVGGNYGATLSVLADGVHPIQARAIDLAGNVSAATPALNVTIDTVAPPTPIAGPDLASASDSGLSNTDNITSDNTPQFDGAAPVNDIVRLFAGGVLVGSDTTTASGTYSIVTSTLTDGTKVMQTRFEDLAGNQSALGPSLSVVIDTVAPAAPTVAPDLSASSDSGISSTDNITNDATPIMTGTVPANEIVRLFDGATLVGSDISTGTGSYTILSSTLANGVRSMSVRFEDVAGNRSNQSPSLSVTIDTVAPSLIGSAVFNFNTAPHSLTYGFSENVGPTLAPADFTVTRLPATIVTTAVGYNSGTNRATVTFPTATNGVLADGDYRSVLAAAGVTDVAGNALSSGNTFNFLFYIGDADNNGVIDFDDYVLIDNGFNNGLSGFTNGDFNYDGVIDFDDYVLIDFAFNNQ